MRGYEVLNPDSSDCQSTKTTNRMAITRGSTRLYRHRKMPRMNLCEQARLRNVAICEVLFSSGIRVSELIKLDRDSIKNRKFVISGKSKNSRPCFISKRAEKALNEYLATRVDHCCALFISTQEDKRMTDQSVRHFFKRLAAIPTFVKSIRILCATRSQTYLLEKGLILYLLRTFSATRTCKPLNSILMYPARSCNSLMTVLWRAFKVWCQ